MSRYLAFETGEKGGGNCNVTNNGNTGDEEMEDESEGSDKWIARGKYYSLRILRYGGSGEFCCEIKIYILDMLRDGCCVLGIDTIGMISRDISTRSVAISVVND